MNSVDMRCLAILLVLVLMLALLTDCRSVSKDPLNTVVTAKNTQSVLRMTDLTYEQKSTIRAYLQRTEGDLPPDGMTVRRILESQQSWELAEHNRRRERREASVHGTPSTPGDSSMRDQYVRQYGSAFPRESSSRPDDPSVGADTTPPATETPRVRRMNDSILVRDLKITVRSAEIKRPEDRGEQGKADPLHGLLVITVDIDCPSEGGERTYYGPSLFRVIDGEGREYDPYTDFKSQAGLPYSLSESWQREAWNRYEEDPRWPEFDYLLDTGVLDPGGWVRDGKVAFEVPLLGIGRYVLHFTRGDPEAGVDLGW